MNLLANACGALNERYPAYHPDKVLRVTASGFERQGRPWVRITVEDHGVGITAEIRDRVFDPFFTTKPREKAAGLGLSVGHGIVREHGGEISIESEPGRGTRVHVDLPVDSGGSAGQALA
jgi:signal transduction histidine kinase